MHGRPLDTDQLKATQERLRSIAEQQSEKKAEAARLNREKCPELTAWILDFKTVFGPGVKVKWIRWPDGSEQGTRGPPGVQISIEFKEEEKWRASSRQSKRN
jgi:hypothetical protein